MAKTAISCLFTEWVAGAPETALKPQTHVFTALDVTTDQLHFEVAPVAGKPFRIGLVFKAAAKLQGVRNVLEAYPAKGSFVTFGIPATLKTVHVTLLRNTDSFVVCCHGHAVPPGVLLADYQANKLAFAKYVTVPLPE